MSDALVKRRAPTPKDRKRLQKRVGSIKTVSEFLSPRALEALQQPEGAEVKGLTFGGALEQPFVSEADEFLQGVRPGRGLRRRRGAQAAQRRAMSASARSSTAISSPT